MFPGSKKKKISICVQTTSGGSPWSARPHGLAAKLPPSQFTLEQTLCQRTGHVRLLLGHGDTETRSRDNGDTAVAIPCGRQEAKALNYEQTVVARGPESGTTLGSPFMPRSPATAQGAGSILFLLPPPPPTLHFLFSL